MTIVALAVIFFAFTIVFSYYSYKAYRQKTRLGTYVGRTLIVSNLVMWAYAFNIFAKSVECMLIFCCLEHIFMDWALFFLCGVAVQYTGYRVFERIKMALIVLLSLDSAILLTNPINHLAFNYSVRTGKGYLSVAASANMFFYFHIGCCAVLLSLIVSMLIRKIHDTSKYYVSRDVLLLGIFSAIVAFNVAYAVDKNATLDYSRFLFGAGVALLYYSIFSFSPIGLLRRIQGYIDDHMSDAVISYDIDGKIIKINEEAKKLLPVEIREDCDALLHFLGDISEAGKYIVNIDVSSYEVLYNPIIDEKQRYIASYFIFHDVTEAEKQLEIERRAATTDSLTGTNNRLGFMEHAKTFMREHAKDDCYALVISGIFNFKGINGLYGTRTGDRVLREISRKYQEFDKSVQMVYGRTAEGKFACIIPFNYVEEIVNRVQSIPIVLNDDATIHVEMCHGFVIMNRKGCKLADYYEMALLALARSKKNAGSAVEYSQHMADEIQRQQLLLGETHDAIANDEFYIELQPQMDLTKKVVCGAEALIRWNHPSLGKIGPGEFIPLFESNGFITKLDRHVWDYTAKMLRDFHENGLYDGPISVNVSQVDIMNTDVIRDLEMVVSKYDIDRSKLHVEITESACAENRDILIKTLNELREKGFKVEIDDFGSGYSSLNALMSLPFDIVKLDMSFMKAYDTNPKSLVVIGSITQMIHKMDAEIIVEGVETEEQVQRALGLKANVVQGYYYSKPLAVEDFTEFVKKYNS